MSSFFYKITIVLFCNIFNKVDKLKKTAKWVQHPPLHQKDTRVTNVTSERKKKNQCASLITCTEFLSGRTSHVLRLTCTLGDCSACILILFNRNFLMFIKRY